MPDFAPDAFTLWFTCNQDKKTEGAYWASSDVPVEEIEKLYNWALTQNHGHERQRATLRAAPRQPAAPAPAKPAMSICCWRCSDQKAKAESTNSMPF